MPRRHRVHVPGGLYHAVLRGNHRQAIFGSDDDYRKFEEIVARALTRYGASLFAYCWMTNHVHLAVRVGEAPLGAVMRIVASRYARVRQQTLATTGHLFERRYRARLVDADRYLLALVRYIHLNPVRAQMVADPRDYPWSSHRTYLGTPCPGWLQTEPVLAMFGRTPDAARTAYLRFLNEAPSDAERAQIVPGVRVLGADRETPDGSARMNACDARDGPRGLEVIAAEVAADYRLAMEDVLSRRRLPELVQARTEIARRALLAGAANLSQIAKYLNRSPSTLSDLLHRQYGR